MRNGTVRRRAVMAAVVVLTTGLLTACADPQDQGVAPAANTAVAPSAASASAPAGSTGESGAGSSAAAVSVPSGFDTSPDQTRPTAKADPAAVAALPAEVAKSGTLVVGGGFAGGGTPPLGFIADDDATPIGVEIDFAHLIADKLGLTTDLQITTWENLFIGVDSGKYQVVLSNVGVSEERKEKYDFATYRLGLHAWETKKGSGLSVKEPADVAGKSVAVGSGTLQEGILLDWDAQNQAEGLPAVDVRYYQAPTDIYLALASGRIDLYLGPNPTATYHVVTGGQTEIVGTVSSSYPLDGKVAVMTKKDNGMVKALAAAIDSAIADGTYQQVLDKWGLGGEAVSAAEINPPGLPKPTSG